MAREILETQTLLMLALVSYSVLVVLVYHMCNVPVCKSMLYTINYTLASTCILYIVPVYKSML